MKQQVVFLFIIIQNMFLSTEGHGAKCSCTKEDITKLKAAMNTLRSDVNRDLVAMKTDMAILVLEMAKLVAKTNENMDTLKNHLSTIGKNLETHREVTSVIDGNVAKMGTQTNELNSAIVQNGVKLNALKAQVTETSNCACENKRRRDRIYYAGWSREDGYMFTFAQAKAHCEGQGHRIATPGQMDAAFELGLSECAWGWLSDGSTRYPMQMPVASGSCGPRRHVNTILNKNPHALAGVYCSRG